MGRPRSNAEVGAVSARSAMGSSDSVCMLRSAAGVYHDGLELVVRTHPHPASMLQMRHLGEAYRTLQLGIVALESGFYEQVFILTRSAAEAWLVYWYLVVYRPAAFRWIGDGQTPVPKVQSMLGHIDRSAVLLHGPDRLHNMARARFDGAGRFPNSVLSELDPLEPEPRTDLGFDVALFDAAGSELALWFGVMLQAVAREVQGNNRWHERQAATIAEISAYLSRADGRAGSTS